MGVLTYKGATAKEALASEVVGAVPSWQKKEKLPPQSLPGARLFAQSGCTSCHTYLGTGSSNLGAPDLTEIGQKHLGIDFQVRHLKCPSCVNPGSPMPSFASYPTSDLRKLATFLEASKGTSGGGGGGPPWAEIGFIIALGVATILTIVIALSRGRTPAAT